MNILRAKKCNKKWETTYEGKNMSIQTKYSLHYNTKYIANDKKLVQEFSTSHDSLCYKSYLHSKFPLEQQSADMTP